MSGRLSDLLAGQATCCPGDPLRSVPPPIAHVHVCEEILGSGHQSSNGHL